MFELLYREVGETIVRPLHVCGIGCLVLGSAAAAAPHAAPSVASGKGLDGLLACRAIPDTTARLACFDDNAARLAAAEASRDIVVMDREQVRETRKSVFGFSLPRLPVFGGNDKDEVKQIEAVASGARADRDGRWLIILQDGARWQQTDDNAVPLPPHAGSKIVIRRAALGSFFMRVDGQPGFKAQRVG